MNKLASTLLASTLLVSTGPTLVPSMAVASPIERNDTTLLATTSSSSSELSDEQATALAGILLLFFFGVGLFIYFLPWFISIWRKSPYTAPVFVINLLAGWSGVGWLLAIVLAVWPNDRNF